MSELVLFDPDPDRVAVSENGGEILVVTPSGPRGEKGEKGDTGDTGPANTLSIGTVVSSTNPTATITGAAPNQTLNLELPKGEKGEKGDTGPANTLTIGTVVSSAVPTATITGTAPNQVLNLELAKGDKGDQGDRGVGVAIRDTLTSTSELPTTPSDPIDGYLIDGDLYIWVNGAWTNAGPFRGEKGDQGIQGDQGPQGDTGYLVQDGANGYPSRPVTATGPITFVGPDAPGTVPGATMQDGDVYISTAVTANPGIKVGDLADVSSDAPTANGQTLLWDQALGLYAPGQVTTHSHGLTWHYVGEAGEPAFENNWTNYNYSAADTNTYERVSFAKSLDGRVHLRGLPKSGSSGSVIFTLPVGYRPPYHLLLGTISGGNTNAGRIDILPTGGVQMVGGSTGWISLDNLSFYAG